MTCSSKIPFGHPSQHRQTCIYPCSSKHFTTCLKANILLVPNAFRGNVYPQECLPTPPFISVKCVGDQGLDWINILKKLFTTFSWCVFFFPLPASLTQLRYSLIQNDKKQNYWYYSEKLYLDAHILRYSKSYS